VGLEFLSVVGTCFDKLAPTRCPRPTTDGTGRASTLPCIAPLKGVEIAETKESAYFRSLDNAVPHGLCHKSLILI